MGAALSQSEAVVQTMSYANPVVTWRRTGVGPQLSAPPELWISSDGVSFSYLGFMSSVAGGGWHYTSVPTPAIGHPFYLRTRGRVISGYPQSQGVLETTRQFVRWN